MPAVGGLKFAYLAFVARPRCDRQLYRLVKRQQICRIVELGIDSLARSIHLIGVAQRYSSEAEIRYTGLDLFDLRSEDRPPLRLIEAHRQLQLTGGRVRLIPGEPADQLCQAANSLPKTDLVVISPQFSDVQLSRTWFYVPRMCHPNTTVLRGVMDSSGQPDYRVVHPVEIAEASRQVAKALAA